MGEFLNFPPSDPPRSSVWTCPQDPPTYTPSLPVPFLFPKSLGPLTSERRGEKQAQASPDWCGPKWGQGLDFVVTAWSRYTCSGEMCSLLQQYCLVGGGSQLLSA